MSDTTVAVTLSILQYLKVCFYVPGVWMNMFVSRTLVHHVKSEDSTMVAVLLFWVPGKTDVLSLIFKSDVPQQDGDVVVLGGANKLHTLVINGDPGLHTLNGNHCFTQLHTYICTLDTQRQMVKCTVCLCCLCLSVCVCV